MRTKSDGVTTFIKTKVVPSSKFLKLVYRKTLHSKNSDRRPKRRQTYRNNSRIPVNESSSVR